MSHPRIGPDNTAIFGKNTFASTYPSTAFFFQEGNDMATSVPQALETACQALLGAVNGTKALIKSLKEQVLRTEETLNQLLAVKDPDQATLDQIKQVQQMLKTLQDQVTQQQANLIGAENDYYANCPPSPPSKSTK
jgi:septal ring factor EnvC (AmiA/AmiB activator)